MEVILLVLDGTDFMSPAFLGKLSGLHSGLGSICSLRVTTEPSLLCCIRTRSAAASSISPVE